MASIGRGTLAHFVEKLCEAYTSTAALRTQSDLFLGDNAMVPILFSSFRLQSMEIEYQRLIQYLVPFYLGFSVTLLNSKKKLLLQGTSIKQPCHLANLGIVQP